MIRPEEISIDESATLGSGKSVYKADYQNGVGAVKVLSSEASVTALHTRAAIWEGLDHPNVLKIFGVCTEDADPLFIVTEYQSFGDAARYLKTNPNVDRAQIVLDVACGMQFIHSRNVIHGGLKTSDILIKDDGTACITDYGMSEIQSTKNNDAHRYFSPEAWKGITSKPSDVYAFAMCAYEIFTSLPPWGVLPEKHIIRMVCHEDVRPDRPDPTLSIRVGLTDQIWDIVEESWHKEARMRPTFDIVVRLWQAACNGSISSPPAPCLERSSSNVNGTRRQMAIQPEVVDEHDVPPAYSLAEDAEPQQRAFQASPEPEALPNPHSQYHNMHPRQSPSFDEDCMSEASSSSAPRSRLSLHRGPSSPASSYYRTSSPPSSAPPGVQSFDNLPPLRDVKVRPLDIKKRDSKLPYMAEEKDAAPYAQPLQPYHNPRLSVQPPTPASPLPHVNERPQYHDRQSMPPQPTVYDESARPHYNQRQSMPATAPCGGGSPGTTYGVPGPGVARSLTRQFSGMQLGSMGSSGVGSDLQSISDIGSISGMSSSGGVNPVLIAGALQAEVRQRRDPHAIDEYLMKIHFLASQSDKSAQKLITAGVIPTLIHLLKTRAAADERLEPVLIALGTLAYDSLSANTIYRTDTTTTLIELFASSESDDVAALALWNLTRLTRTTDIANGLIKRGLPKQLVERGLHGGSRGASLSAWCLGNLIQSDSIAETLADQGIVPDIVDHLRHSTNLITSAPDDISSGLFVIARMARSIKLAKILAKAGCVDLLAHHLNTSTDPSVLHWSARAVGCLMRPNSSDMSKILLEKGVAGGLARLPSVLPTEEVEPLASFAFAIQRFSCAEWGGGTRKALVDAGVVDSLLAALRTAADEPYPQVHIELALAVSFLGDVGGSSIRKEIVHAGGVKILKSIAQNGNPEVAKACNMAATSISGNIWTRNAASAKTAMNHNWSGGCPEYHPPCPVQYDFEEVAA
ncbi:hypothetical protein VNI00_013298 [Paramarasmius palmivorus]|uniref:Protein kinase domain-containing protein n=1 Tax=Paramarasmius palmivorus TaxID=297713 RepID=A0AAW0BZX4_9AGAR